jgi:hypothetical protein
VLCCSGEGDPAGFSAISLIENRNPMPLGFGLIRRSGTFATRSLALVWKTEYLGICTEKGLPVESQGRKATGLRAHAYDSGAARYRLMQRLSPEPFHLAATAFLFSSVSGLLQGN